MFVKRFDIPVPEDAAKEAIPYRPRRDAAGDLHAPSRAMHGGSFRGAEVPKLDFKAPALDSFAEWTARGIGRAARTLTTMGFVRSRRT